MNIIFTNTLYQLLAKLVSTITTLFLTVVITRFLGAKTWGDFSAVLAFIGFYYVLSEFGLNSIATKQFTEASKITKKSFLNFFFLRGAFTVFLLLVGIIILKLLKYPPYLEKAILFVMLQVFIYSLSSTFNSIYQSKHLYKYLFFSTFLYSLVNLITFILLVFVFKIYVLWVLFVPVLLAEISRFTFNFLVSKKFLSSPSFSLDINLVKKYAFLAFPLGIALVFNTLMTQIDRLMLSKMVDTLFLGYYSLAYKLFEVLLVLPTFFMNSMFPLLVQSFKNKNSLLYNLYFSKSVFLLFVSSFILILFGTVLAPFLIPLIWGKEMLPAVSAFIILIVGSPLFYISSPISWLFVVENKTKVLTYLYLFAFLFNFLTNLYAIPRYNYLGATYTTLLTEALVLIVLEFYRRKYLKASYTKFDLKSLKVWKR